MYLTLHLKLSKTAKLNHMHQRSKTSKESIYQLCLLLRLELCTCLYCTVPFFPRMFLQFTKIILNFNPILQLTPGKKKNQHKSTDHVLNFCARVRQEEHLAFLFLDSSRNVHRLWPHISLLLTFKRI